MGKDSAGEIALDLKLNNSRNFLNDVSGIAKKAAGMFAAAFTIKGITEFGKDCLELGSDLEEVQNVVDVTFPKMSAQIDSFAKNAAAKFGLSETMAKQYTGTFGSMAEAFGFTEKQAADMGTTLTGLAGDVASFYNLSQDVAYTKIKSVFTGETESLKDLGVVMTQTALDSYALANGFGKTTSKMTEAEKVALRYSFVQQQLSNATGDFARTSGSWANQVRILSLQFDSLKANIGQGLINLFTPIIKAINTVIAKVVTLASAFKALTEMFTGKKSDDSGIAQVASSALEATSGIEEASDAANDLEDSTTAAGKAAKKAAKEMLGLMGYDELNNLTSSKDSDSTSGSSSASIPSVDFGKLDTSGGEKALEGLGTKAQAVIDKIKELGKLFVKGFKIGVGDLSVFDSIKKQIKSIKKSFKNIISDEGLQEAVKSFVKSLATCFGKVAGSIASIGLTIADNITGGIAKYLKQHKKDIIEDLKALFDISGAIADIIGNFSAFLAEIAEVFRSDDAKQITADLINIFVEAKTNLILLMAKIGRDILNALTRPFTENKDAIKEVLENTIKPVKTVIHSISTAVSNTWDKIQAVYDEHISPLIESLGAGISDIVATLLDGYNTYVAPVLDKLAKKFKAVMEDKVQPAIDTVLDAFGDLADTVKVLWEKVIQPFFKWVAKNIMPQFANAIERAGEKILTAISGISDVFKGLGKAFSGICEIIQGIVEGDWKKVWEGCKKTVSGIWDAIVALFSTAWNLIKAPFKGVADFFKGVWNNIKGAFPNVSEWFKSHFEKAYQNTTLAFKLAGTYFKNKWSEIRGAFPSVAAWFQEKFADAYKKVSASFSNVGKTFSSYWQAIKAPFSGIAKWFKDKFSNAWGAVKAVFSTGGKVYAGITSGIESTFKTIVNALIRGINSLIKAPFNSINNMLNTIREVGVAGIKPFKNLWSKNPLSVPQIPMLAQGGYVKANTPQLAMIGDNRRYGEIVAPEDKMQAMADAAAIQTGEITAKALIPVIERLCNAIIELEQSGAGQMPELVPVSETGLYRIVEDVGAKEGKRRKRR